MSAPTRRWIGVAGLLTACQSVATVVMGLMVGLVTAGLIEQPGRPLSSWAGHLGALAAAVLVRGTVSFAQSRFAHRAAAAVTVDLRAKALERLALADPRRVDRAAWRTTLGTGIEGLGPYLTGFLPALAGTVIATPVMLAVVWWLDTPSFLIALVTVPLIPFFMWLVGTLTAGRTERRLRDLSVLTDQLLDLIAGLPTLRTVDRQRDTLAEVRRLSDRHTGSTVSVLRIAFLSSLVLEFLATLSVALMAVGIGFRLLDGNMTLAAGLTVLVIAPEVYNPIREVGTRFHDAQDGLAATDAVLGALAGGAMAGAARPGSADTGSGAADTGDTDSGRAEGDAGAAGVGVGAGAGAHADRAGSAHAEADGTSSSKTDEGVRVVFAHLTVPDRDGARPHDLSGVAEPGALTVLAGPNGAGKSTALLALLGIVTDGVTGTAHVESGGEVLDRDELWRRVSYLPQRPVLDPASVGDTSGLSLGQRQRVAFARELERDAALMVCDEPTAHLDEENALVMIDQLRRRAADGVTVVAASHDPLLIAAADRVIEVNA
ncbi:ABC transporter permease [Corynebacterium frankenforstense DSM 45800]|uniref:ABC transporter permease n=1 Tax=Corynebacterium frankenforstense DSM 45800 TaxID=1437875 RepID=A0A1L7CS43_9CORY|nr:ABC transporter permease [Corynebacterium frankenforstense DSM 45800]